ncbi:MAG: helix-turn-helix domain-containing protein [Alphaproteobacteria bacterium]|nr:helix-turn-helix domain-containing protein [Alphaproteobacteria bacterium]
MQLNQKYLNQKQVAEVLGVKIETLNHWRAVKRYKIPYTKVGRIILYPEAEFYKWLELASHHIS